jgi:hypothetical protein
VLIVFLAAVGSFKWLRWGDMAEVLQGKSWGSTGQVFETKLQIWAMFGDVSRFF